MIHIDQFTWRLGNQLFQLAAAINLAEENLDKVSFPEWKYAKYFEGNFGPVKFIRDNIASIYIEPQFAYNKIPYCRNMAINGYFQSDKYFKNSSRLIKKMFKLKDEYQIQPEKKTCSIHVRRTDYIELNQHFHTLTIADYYRTAIDWAELFSGGIDKFYVMSDDIEWCAKEFCLCDGDYVNAWCPVHSNNDKIDFFRGQNEIHDFAKMQSCSHNIIANSSYSWWAAYLNPNPDKLVFAPDHAKWFGPALHFHDTKDLIPKEWTRL